MTTWTVAGRKLHLRWGRQSLGTVALVALGVLVLAGAVVAFTRADLGRDDRRGSTATARDASSAGEDTATGVNTAGSGGGVAIDAGSASTGTAVPSFTSTVVRTADIRVRVRGSFVAAVDRATAVASLLGGFVSSSSTSSLERGQSSAELTMRVPANQFDEARRRLTGLGKLESLEEHGRDVGGELVDLDARLRAARAEEVALSALLTKAGDIGSILQLRDRMSAVRTQIEQLDGQQAALRDQVALSTLHISMHEAGAPAHKTSERNGDGTSIGESARDALHASEAVLGGMLIVVGALAPLAAAGLLGWFVYWVAVRRRPKVVEQTFE